MRYIINLINLISFHRGTVLAPRGVKIYIDRKHGYMLDKNFTKFRHFRSKLVFAIEKYLEVSLFFVDAIRFSPNVTMPPFVKDNEYALAGLLVTR